MKLEHVTSLLILVFNQPYTIRILHFARYGHVIIAQTEIKTSIRIAAECVAKTIDVHQ